MLILYLQLFVLRERFRTPKYIFYLISTTIKLPDFTFCKGISKNLERNLVVVFPPRGRGEGLPYKKYGEARGKFQNDPLGGTRTLFYGCA